MRISITVASERGPRVLEVSGELDIDSAPRLCAAIHGEQRPLAGEDVIADLSALEFCDSTGLRALIDAAREVEVAGGRMIVVVPEDGPLRRTLRLAGAEEFLNLARAEAVKSAG
jgi:anti-sigma B factor antagonist